MKFGKIVLLLLVLIAVIYLKPNLPRNIWISLFVFTQSVLLALLIYKNKFKTSRLVIFIMLTLFVGTFILATGVYKNTFSISSFDRNQLWARREMYLRDLGTVGRHNIVNQSVLVSTFNINKFNQKISPPLDLTRYFFVGQSSIYFLILFPFFIVGIIALLAKNFGIIIYYLGLAVMSSVFIKPDLTYWLYVPLINLGILQSVLNIKSIFRNE
jgi:hypothetical protein